MAMHEQGIAKLLFWRRQTTLDEKQSFILPDLEALCFATERPNFVNIKRIGFDGLLGFYQQAKTLDQKITLLSFYLNRNNEKHRQFLFECMHAENQNVRDNELNFLRLLEVAINREQVRLSDVGIRDAQMVEENAGKIDFLRQEYSNEQLSRQWQVQLNLHTTNNSDTIVARKVKARLDFVENFLTPLVQNRTYFAHFLLDDTQYTQQLIEGFRSVFDHAAIAQIINAWRCRLEDDREVLDLIQTKRYFFTPSQLITALSVCCDKIDRKPLRQYLTKRHGHRRFRRGSHQSTMLYKLKQGVKDRIAVLNAQDEAGIARLVKILSNKTICGLLNLDIALVTLLLEKSNYHIDLCQVVIQNSRWLKQLPQEISNKHILLKAACKAESLIAKEPGFLQGTRRKRFIQKLVESPDCYQEQLADDNDLKYALFSYVSNNTRMWRSLMHNAEHYWFGMRRFKRSLQDKLQQLSRTNAFFATRLAEDPTVARQRLVESARTSRNQSAQSRQLLLQSLRRHSWHAQTELDKTQAAAWIKLEKLIHFTELLSRNSLKEAIAVLHHLVEFARHDQNNDDLLADALTIATEMDLSSEQLKILLATALAGDSFPANAQAKAIQVVARINRNSLENSQTALCEALASHFDIGWRLLEAYIDDANCAELMQGNQRFFASWLEKHREDIQSKLQTLELDDRIRLVLPLLATEHAPLRVELLKVLDTEILYRLSGGIQSIITGPHLRFFAYLLKYAFDEQGGRYGYETKFYQQVANELTADRVLLLLRANHERDETQRIDLTFIAQIASDKLVSLLYDGSLDKHALLPSSSNLLQHARFRTAVTDHIAKQEIELRTQQVYRLNQILQIQASDSDEFSRWLRKTIKLLNQRTDALLVALIDDLETETLPANIDKAIVARIINATEPLSPALLVKMANRDESHDATQAYSEAVSEALISHFSDHEREFTHHPLIQEASETAALDPEDQDKMINEIAERLDPELAEFVTLVSTQPMLFNALTPGKNEQERDAMRDIIIDALTTQKTRQQLREQSRLADSEMADYTAANFAKRSPSPPRDLTDDLDAAAADLQLSPGRATAHTL